MGEVDTAKRRKLILIGVSTLVVILVVVTILAYLGGADTTITGSLGAAAAAAAAAAAKTRGDARKAAKDAQNASQEVKESILLSVDKAKREMRDNESEVEEETDPGRLASMGDEVLGEDS